MKQPLFEGVNARCRHDFAIPGEYNDCATCQWENEILALKPPFRVECIDDKGITLKAGEEYLCIAVIRDGETSIGDSAPGLLLEGDKVNTAFVKLYKASRFMAVEKK